MQERAHIPAGTRFGGDFTLLHTLGAGAYATVYEAREESLGRIVALKVLDRADATARARFLAEARTMAAFHHPGIAEVHRFGTDEATGLPFLAMDRFAGSLADRITDSRVLSEADAAALGLALADALAALHGHTPPLVHRDIKPSNILFADDGRAVLSDFGLVRRLSPDATALTSPDAGQPGTWLYAAPEQRAGKPSSPAADWYALGVTLFRCLTGGFPGPGGALPIDVAKEVSRAWQPLLRGLLDEDPGRRLSDPDAIRATLLRIADHCRRRTGLRRLRAVAILCAIAAVSAAVALVSRRKPPPEPPPPEPPPPKASLADILTEIRPALEQIAARDAATRERWEHQAEQERKQIESAMATNRVDWNNPALPQPLQVVRDWLVNRVSPDSATDGVLRVVSGEVLFSGDIPPDAVDPPTILLDGGHLLVAPSAGALDEWAGRYQMWNLVGYRTMPRPEPPTPPSVFPATVLIGDGGGTIDDIKPLINGRLVLTGSVKRAPGARNASLLIRAADVSLNGKKGRGLWNF